MFTAALVVSDLEPYAVVFFFSLSKISARNYNNT